MKISDTIREAALYSEHPFIEMPNPAYNAFIRFHAHDDALRFISDVNLRTAMLFVAEALES